MVGLALAAGLAAPVAPRANGAAEDDAALRDARAACAVATAEALQERYDAVSDIEARFEQTTVAVALGATGAASRAVSRGRVLFAKPGRMRWEYEEPTESLVVSDGGTLWIYTPAEKQAQKLPVESGGVSGAALEFLLGAGDLEANFRLSTADDCTRETVRLDLEPREEASFERLTLVVDRSNGQLRSTSMRDLFGNVTTIAFSQMQMDLRPSADLFRFEPPTGTTVVDLASPQP